MKEKIIYTIAGMFLFGVLCIVVAKGQGQTSEEDKLSDGSIEEVEVCSDKIPLSLEERVSLATHILKAEYVGKVTTEHGTELMFCPDEIYKGEMEQETFYVPLNTEDGNYQLETCYLLFLEKNSSVYYEHDKYVPLGESVVSETDESWNAYSEEVQLFCEKEENNMPEEYGNEFTESEAIQEVLAVTKHIFFIMVDRVFAESTKAPTTVYRCKVKKAVLDQPVVMQDETILIPFFQDTVEVGGEYVVLLGDSTKSAPVYTLASKQSVYTLEEAEKIPELKEMVGTEE